MGVIIKSIEFALPKTKESLEDVLKENPNWDVKKILSKTGIKNRYVSQNNEDIISLSVKSARKILKNFKK